jgi:RimJ/RimL family protein N-acetyltransferase
VSAGPLVLHAPGVPLSDGRVVLRLPREHDIEALVRFGDDPDTAETIWVPIPTPCSEQQARERLDEFSQGWTDGTGSPATLIIADSQTDEMIGVMFLRLREAGSVEVVYGIAAPNRNRGNATAAVRLVSDWCLADLGASRVELRIDTNNEASQRVADKSGFTHAGAVKQLVPATGAEYDDLLYVRTLSVSTTEPATR